ncbi:MAG TPA: IMP dehydrogenase, partial [Actinomycetota bacterium]|nr:IMP dehydrogenase [Actinomycetota bacterium]
MEIEIGKGKKARRAYGFDEISIVPSRRTRDPDDVDVSWELDAWRFGLPMMASAMDAVVSPSSAIEIGRLGGLACLNLEGLWSRYDDPMPIYERIAEASPEEATKILQDVYTEPVKGELIRKAIKEIKAGGVVACASLTPQRVEQYAADVLAAELDILAIQGTVVSANHVSQTRDALNLKEFIRDFELPVIVGGCASY